MGYLITEIEDGILATLQADSDLASVVTWEVLTDLRRETWQRLIRRYPAIGVLSQQGSYDYSIPSVQDETGTFAVICIHRNLRAASDALRGSTGEIGVWDMIDACRNALLNSTLGKMELINCVPVRRQLLFAAGDWAAASLDVEIMWRHTPLGGG